MKLDPHPGFMSSVESSEVADAAERVCAWAENLEELGRSDDALRILWEALDRHGGEARIALTLAGLEMRTGAPERAAVLLRKVVDEGPDDIAAIRMLAQALLAAGETGEAALVVTDAASRLGRAGAGELAELAGEIFRAQGKHAKAVAAFGSRASLSSRGRRLRRGSWWRSGGPLRRRSSWNATYAETTAVETPDPPDAVLELVTWAKWLSAEGRHDEARQVVSEALTTHGRHLRLLVCSAEIEDAAGAKNTSLLFWREAYREAPQDIDVVCGLAKCLTNTPIKLFYVYKVGDALRVLSGFPDQGHPKIRAARASALYSDGAPAARVVAAYGPVSGLLRADVRRRRRLWWRSAGPLGQWGMRITDRARGERQLYPGTDPLLRTEAESEAVARALDSIQLLPTDAAAERIEEALREHGRQPSLLLSYIDADWATGADWHRLAIAAEAARGNPRNADAISNLAWALKATDGYGAALQVLEALPATERQAVDLRVSVGNLHRYAGNFALAVIAYGDPRDLGDYYRKVRRRCARKALVQRIRANRGDDVGGIDFTTFDPVPPEIAKVLDRGNRPTDQPATLRELYESTMKTEGRHPYLLLALANLEGWHGDRHASAALAAEAKAIAPEDPLIVAECIKTLWSAHYFADALHSVENLPERVKSSPTVRRIAGENYAALWLWAHAVTAFGHGGLEARWRRVRRSCWWRSGGPIGRIRASIRSDENLVLSVSVLPARHTAVLSALPLPAPVVEALRGDLATHQMASTRETVFVARTLEAWLGRIGLLASIVVVFAALTLTERLRWPSAPITRGLAAAAFATVAEVAAALILDRYIRRAVTWIGVATACAAGAAVLLRSHGQPAFDAGLALAALASVIVVASVLRQALLVALRIRGARWQRRHAETSVLSALLSLLGQLNAPRLRRDAGSRRSWMAELERTAVMIERDLPHALRSGDPDSHGAIVAHAHGAATALRGMKLAVALPQEASWQALIDQLTGLVTALGRHDFENWPPPIAAVITPRPQRPLWLRVTDVTRTVLVIFVPPLVAYLLPLAVPLSGPGLSWLRFATIVWALLGTIIALDPASSDKIAKMRELLDFLRSATPPKTAHGTAASLNPADVDVREAQDVRNTR